MTDKGKSAATANEGESSSARSSRPTLFNLLEVLANYSMTTPSQRQCIRDIVTEFLANKFEHSKVYSYIGAVVGHDRLHAVIKQLEADPDRSPLPDQDGLMKIESAFNLTRSYKAGGTNGDAGSSKDEILRSIRRNLSKKCELSRNSSVKTASAGVLLQKACWLPIRRPLTAGPLYGHSLICIGNRAYILGGSNGRNQGFNLSKSHLVNLLDFSSKQIMLSGEVPSHREGNSCNVAVLHQTHAVVLFGGFNGEEFFNDVFLLDLEKRRWTKRNPSGPLPTPRDEHSALIYPPRCDLKNANPNKEPQTNPVVYLFVFGGKTGVMGQFHCLNDMWAYNLLGDFWTEVDTGESKPCPRFGVCALWADDETVCVFGGETSSSTGYVDRNERVLLDDLWMFHLTLKHNENEQDELSGVWLQDYYEGNIGPRSHYSSIFIAQRCKEMSSGAPRTVERLMFLTGGLTYAPGNKRVVVASDKLYFYFFSQKRWYSLRPNYPRNYLGEPFEPRQLHVACFFEKKNILFPGTKPSVPCIFFHGGFHKKRILSDAWVLSLTGEDLFFKNSLLSPESTAGKPEPRMYPPWFYRESHSPSLLWGMCSVQKWVFGALAHLVDNARKEGVGSTSLRIGFESCPRGEELLLSVQDDGNGLDYGSMNRLLKLFGRSYTNSAEEPEPDAGREEYGLGFKLAYGRLGNSVAVMSRTHDSIGVGMLSLELMCQCESREMAAPMCMWKLPSKELISRDGPCLIDQRHHQRLLMSYSPFNSAALLAEQINVLGVNPGTRLLFWQLRDDLDSLVLQDGTLFSSSNTHSHAHALSHSNSLNNHEEHDEEGSLVYLKEHLMEAGVVMDSDHNAANPAQKVNTSNNVQHSEPANETGANNETKQDVAENSLYHVEKLLGYQGNWYDVFPLWKTAKHSMDYCLPVYLYWLHLHSSCSLTVQDVHLKPNPVHDHLFEAKRSNDFGDFDFSQPQVETEGNKRERESGAVSDVEDESVKKLHTDTNTLDPLNTVESGDRVDNVNPVNDTNQVNEVKEVKELKLLGTSLNEHNECFLDLHSHVFDNKASGLSMDVYSCGKNTCGYCGVSPIGRSLSGGETLYSFLRAKLHKSVQLPFLFHPEDHSQGAFALIGFLNDPTLTQYNAFSVDKASSAGSTCSNVAGLPSPLNKPLAPTTFVVTETLPAQPAAPASPTRGRKPKARKPNSTTATTQVIYSGSFSSENVEAQETPDGSSQFPGVGAQPSRSASKFFKSSSKSFSDDRVCEAGVLLYYKGRLIRRLEGAFPAAFDDLESARLPPKPSLFNGNVYRFALTAVVNVPNWLVPSITKQEFVHESNRVFLHFKTKLIKLLSEYCKVCMDEHARHTWYLEKVRQIVDYDLAQENALDTLSSKVQDDVLTLDDEVVPFWKLNNEPPQEVQNNNPTTTNTTNVTTTTTNENNQVEQ